MIQDIIVEKYNVKKEFKKHMVNKGIIFWGNIKTMFFIQDILNAI